MGLPLILAGAQLALGIGSAIFGHKGQKDQARASERAAAEQKKQVTAAANKSAAFEKKMLGLRMEENAIANQQTIEALAARRAEEKRATGMSILASDRAVRMADATARLSSGAAGVAGASVDAVLSDLEAQGAQSRFGLNENLAATTRQLDRQDGAQRQTFAFTQRQLLAEHAGIEANRQNRIAGVSNLPTAPRPNPLATALQIGGAFLDFGNHFTTRKP